MTAPAHPDLITWVEQQLENQRHTARALKTLAASMAAETAALLTETADTLTADVDAKRHIMAIHNRRAEVFPNDAGGTFDNCCDGCGYEGICDDPVTENINDCPILRALALPHANQPGYREEWKPAWTHQQA